MSEEKGCCQRKASLKNAFRPGWVNCLHFGHKFFLSDSNFTLLAAPSEEESKLFNAPWRILKNISRLNSISSPRDLLIRSIHSRPPVMKFEVFLQNEAGILKLPRCFGTNCFIPLPPPKLFGSSAAAGEEEAAEKLKMFLSNFPMTELRNSTWILRASLMRLDFGGFAVCYGGEFYLSRPLLQCRG